MPIKMFYSYFDADKNVLLVHTVQNKNYKNYIVEISSTLQNNVNDQLTPYCKQNEITIRPWKGKLPSQSFPKFI